MKPKFLLNNYTRRYYQGNNEFDSNMQLQSLIRNNSKKNYHRMDYGVINIKNYQTINNNVCNSNHNSRPCSGRISNSAHLNLYSNYTVDDYFQTRHKKSIALINSLKNKKFENEMNSIRSVPQINSKSKKMKINRKPIYNQIPKPSTEQSTLNNNTKLVSISSVKQTKSKYPQPKSSNISSPSLPEATSIKTPQIETIQHDEYTNRQQMRQNDLNKFRHFANNIMN